MFWTFQGTLYCLYTFCSCQRAFLRRWVNGNWCSNYLLWIFKWYFACFNIKGFTGSSGSWLDRRECLPVATFDNTVITTAQNATVTKHSLGHYKNISSCVLDCCGRKNCDLVLFDGNLCYGLFCSTEHVCRFQTAREGQRSFQAVLLNNAFKGKSTLNWSACLVWQCNIWSKYYNKQIYFFKEINTLLNRLYITSYAKP